MLIPFRRERARTLRVLALAAITTTAAPQGTTRRSAIVRIFRTSSFEVILRGRFPPPPLYRLPPCFRLLRAFPLSLAIRYMAAAQCIRPRIYYGR